MISEQRVIELLGHEDNRVRRMAYELLPKPVESPEVIKTLLAAFMSREASDSDLDLEFPSFGHVLACRLSAEQLKQVCAIRDDSGQTLIEAHDIDLTEYPHLITGHHDWLVNDPALHPHLREYIRTFASLMDLPPEQFWQQLVEMETLRLKAVHRRNPKAPSLFEDQELATRAAAQLPAVRSLATAALRAATSSRVSPEQSVAVSILAAQADAESVPAILDFMLLIDADSDELVNDCAVKAIATVRDPALVAPAAARFNQFDEYAQSGIAIAIGSTRSAEAEQALLQLFDGATDEITRENVALGLYRLSFASDRTRDALLSVALAQQGVGEIYDLAEEVAVLSVVLGWNDPRSEQLREKVGTDEARRRERSRIYDLQASVIADRLMGLPAKKSIPVDQPTPVPASEPKIGRNDPCPCGSGQKYKKCCLK